MVRSTTKGAKVVLKGQHYTLKYDFNALAELEEAGLPVTRVQERLAESPVSSIRLLVWAGLHHDNPTMTIAEAGDLLDLQQESLAKLAEAIRTAMSEAMPDVEDSSPLETTSTKAGTS